MSKANLDMTPGSAVSESSTASQKHSLCRSLSVSSVGSSVIDQDVHLLGYLDFDAHQADLEESSY